MEVAAIVEQQQAEEVAEVRKSYTGQYLKQVLEEHTTVREKIGIVT